MRVRRGRKRNPLLQREPDDFVTRIKLVDRFAPARGGKFDRQIARPNEVQCFIHDRPNIAARPMTMDLYQVQVRQTIDQTGRRDFPDPPKVILIDLVDVTPDELLSAIRTAVEHLVGIIKVMDGAENKIELV